MTSPATIRIPDYKGGSLINLMAELEHRLTAHASSDRLHPELAAAIPEAEAYVVTLMDGLGAHQLDHPAATDLRTAARGTIDAPFPTTTTVSLASIATAAPPSVHGLLGHIIWLPEAETTVNALKWIRRNGQPVDFDTADLFRHPNLWERLKAAGVEPITVQPGHFEGSPLTRALYRGCRFEPIWNVDEHVEAVVALATTGRRLIFSYLPQVDFAAHLWGQDSSQYADAVEIVNRAWRQIAQRLPPGAVMVGTADHGHLDYSAQEKHFVDSSQVKGVTLFGDPRGLYARGEPSALERLRDQLPAEWYPLETLRTWWGPTGDVDHHLERQPDGVFLAHDGRLLLPGHMDRRLVGYHGGLDPREVKIPLLVAETH